SSLPYHTLSTLDQGHQERPNPAMNGKLVIEINIDGMIVSSFTALAEQRRLIAPSRRCSHSLNQETGTPNSQRKTSVRKVDQVPGRIEVEPVVPQHVRYEASSIRHDNRQAPSWLHHSMDVAQKPHWIRDMFKSMRE